MATVLEAGDLVVAEPFHLVVVDSCLQFPEENQTVVGHFPLVAGDLTVDSAAAFHSLVAVESDSRAVAVDWERMQTVPAADSRLLLRRPHSMRIRLLLIHGLLLLVGKGCKLLLLIRLLLWLDSTLSDCDDSTVAVESDSRLLVIRKGSKLLLLIRVADSSAADCVLLLIRKGSKLLLLIRLLIRRLLIRKGSKLLLIRRLLIHVLLVCMLLLIRLTWKGSKLLLLIRLLLIRLLLICMLLVCKLLLLIRLTWKRSKLLLIGLLLIRRLLLIPTIGRSLLNVGKVLILWWRRLPTEIGKLLLLLNRLLLNCLLWLLIKVGKVLLPLSLLWNLWLRSKSLPETQELAPEHFEYSKRHPTEYYHYHL